MGFIRGAIDHLKCMKPSKNDVSEKKTVVGDMTITTSCTIEKSWNDNYRREVDDREERVYEPTPLRKLKTYNENVPDSFGYDFSAVRRMNSERDWWWLEGANFDKAMRDLKTVGEVEREAARSGRWDEDVAGFIASESLPYSVGADARHVPTIHYLKEKPGCYESELSIHFRIKRSRKDYEWNVSIDYAPNGVINRANIFKSNGYTGESASMFMARNHGRLEIESIKVK